jgi:threonine/homoserine/homoserine lactone efflux protein
MSDLIIKGIIIGLCISIPLGPIGALTVQRTLNRGRKYGIATGLGAMLSDLIYTIIALFFVGFVIRYIEAHQMLFQIAGAIIVIAFGFFIFKNSPSAQAQPNEKSKGSLFSDFITAFGITISNPLILFLLIGLFTHFNFMVEKTISNFFVGILAILLGELLWWLSLTYAANYFKSKIDKRGMRLINRIIGCVIMFVGFLGLMVGILR